MLVDLLIRNARILTQDSEQPVAENLLIHDGKVLALDVDRQSVPRARRVVDAAGAVIVPGFNDVHAHSVWFGLGLMEANLGSVASLDEAYAAIAEAAASLAEDEWVVASGFSPLLHNGAQPDRDRLDAASGGRPVWIKHSSGHACTVNGIALDLIMTCGADLAAPIDGG
ncbi:amidohydrolase family protein, partial [Arthrobacter sp.]|uniref:amidohydrolase family protein n=1 Tax=Arthrobacter sp. TaxID=1667 RepID=UPI0033953293